MIGGGQTHLFSCLIFFFSASVSLSFLPAALGGMVRVRWGGFLRVSAWGVMKERRATRRT